MLVPFRSANGLQVHLFPTPEEIAFTLRRTVSRLRRANVKQRDASGNVNDLCAGPTEVVLSKGLR